jgi:hypothetical protein
MKPKSKSNPPRPEIEPPAGDLPKRFPEQQPLSDDGLEAAKRNASNTIPEARQTPGEDPLVESGLPDDDPERPRETEEEKSNR